MRSVSASLRCFTLLLITSNCLGAEAQTDSQLEYEMIARVLPQAPSDRPFATQGAKVEVTAGEDQNRAVLSYTVSSPAGTKTTLKFSSPLDDSGSTDLATLDGLARGIKGDLSVSFPINWPKRVRLSESSADPAATSGRRAAIADDARRSVSTRNLALRRTAAEQFVREEKAPVALLGSVNAGLSQDDFTWLNTDLTEADDGKHSWYAGVSFIASIPSLDTSLAVTYRRESAYADAATSEVSICEPVSGVLGAQKCRSGFLSSPVLAKTNLLSVEARSLSD